MIQFNNAGSTIIAVGISFRTAPIAVRERFSLTPPEKEILLDQLRSQPEIHEAIILSTCNRTEIYVTLETGYAAARDLIGAVFRVKNIRASQKLTRLFYVHAGDDAVHHLFTVTAGLDSLILGERQILGQFKDAVEFSRERGMMGRHFNILSNLAIRTGKKAQTETEICRGGSSVSWAAVALAEKKLGGLKGKSVLVIGAGKMSQIHLNILHKKGVARIYLMNRSRKRAEHYARRYRAEVISISGLKDIIGAIDLCLCSTSSPGYVIRKSNLVRALDHHRGRPLILIDISVPRNIDPAVGTLEDVQLYVVDQLQSMVDHNQSQRVAAIDAVKQIIQMKHSQYRAKMHGHVRAN